MSSAPRTSLQVEASRRNGARSRGPKTAEGKARSAANRLGTGVYAKEIVPPEEREEVAQGVRSTLRDYSLRSYLAARVAQQAVATEARLVRIERLRQRLAADRLEARVEESDAKRALDHVQQVLAVLTGMVDLASGITEPLPREQADSLLIPVRRVAEVVAELGLEGAVTGALAAAVQELVGDDYRDVLAIAFADLSAAGRCVVRALEDRLPALERAVEQERMRQESMLDLADGRQLRELDRLKVRVIKELDGVVRTLTSIKELESKSSEGKNESTLPPATCISEAAASSR